MRKQFFALVYRDNLGLYFPDGKQQMISCDFSYDGEWYINMNNEEYPAPAATKTLTETGTDRQHAQVPIREGAVYTSTAPYPPDTFKHVVRIKDMPSQRTFYVDFDSYNDNAVTCNDCCIPVACQVATPVVDGDPTDAEATIELTYDGPVAVGWEYVVSESGGGDCVDPTVLGTFSDSKTITVTGLDADTEYCFNVRTICGPNRYSDWTSVKFTTAA